jgi:hypothetical protein
VRERAVGPVGEDLFSLGVPTVVLFSLEHHERGVGEDGVVAPGGEQLALSGCRFLIEVADAADDQPGGGLPPGSEGRVFHLGDLGAETQQPSCSSQMAWG